MRFLKKVEHNNIVKFKIMGVSIFRINKGKFFKVYKFLGIRKNSFFYLPGQELQIQELINVCQAGNVKFFVDIGLGGGTDSYFYIQLLKYKQDFTIIRLQYIQVLKMYQITLFDKEVERILVVNTLSELEKIMLQLNIQEVIISNLVSYPNVLGMLNIIRNIKRPNMLISARGHDFYSVCLFYTLVNGDKFCGWPNNADCQKCFPINTHNGKRDKKLLSGIKNIDIWRKAWYDFYRDIVDEMIVFSQSSYDIFTETYPCLIDKTQIIPHDVPYLRPIRECKGELITIGILGAIESVSKGKKIVQELEKIIATYNDIKLVVIGEYKALSNKTIVIGRYRRENLSDIVSENNINIILIPSIWPETFSYTTSEGMLMGLPVACFNLGAQAERVSKYNKGLIIEEINAEKALSKMYIFCRKIVKQVK